MSQHLTNVEVALETEQSFVTHASEQTDRELLFDFSQSEETRLRAFRKVCETEAEEVTSRLLGILQIGGSSIVREFVTSIIRKCDWLPLKLTAVLAEGLCSVFPDANSYQTLYGFIQRSILDTRLATAHQVELIKILMKEKSYKTQTIEFFCKALVTNRSLELPYVYKSILSLERLEVPVKRSAFFIREAFIAFLSHLRGIPETSESLLYIILTCQYLYLKAMEMQDGELKRIESILFEIGRNESLDENTRGDAVDILLQSSDKTVKGSAQRLILQIGTKGKKGSLAENSQNVHVREIEESVTHILEFLKKFTKTLTARSSVDTIRDDILERVKRDEEALQKVELAFHRIEIDRAVYGKTSMSLTAILTAVYDYALSSPYKDEMKSRMVQELVEASGTCSSGYATRLVNSITGFGELTLNIGWREQIIGNLKGRMNAIIRNLDNLSLRDKVLEEMPTASNKFAERKSFLRIVRLHLAGLREEMYSEFVKHVNDEMFDTYFRSALELYETGGYVE